MKKELSLKIGVVIIKKRNIVIVVISLLLVFSGIRLFLANQEKEAIMESTLLHLEERGYDTAADIEEKYVVNIGEDEVRYAVVVAFRDESDVNYFYTYENDTGQIRQSGVVNTDSNHSLKHQES